MDSSSSDESSGGDEYCRTLHQIDVLERMFEFCPYLDEAQMLELSVELEMQPRQVKIWFQNRRAQMKMQVERDDDAALMAENDRLRDDNAAMKEALRRKVCNNCEQKRLQMENVRLKEELERLRNAATKFLGRPITRIDENQAPDQ